MRPETIFELVRFVTSPGFTIEATASAFGPVASTHLPRTVRFAPEDPMYGLVEVQTDSAERPSMLTIQLASLVRLDFGPLVEAFGEPGEEPRMRPDDPTPWRFAFAGGALTLETTKDEPSGVHEVARIRVRRLG